MYLPTLVSLPLSHSFLPLFFPLVQVSLVQTRMQSKGGYEGKIDVPEAVTPTGTFVVSVVNGPVFRLNLSGPPTSELNHGFVSHVYGMFFIPVFHTICM